MSDSAFGSWANALTRVIANGIGVAEDDASRLGDLAEATFRVFESLAED